MPTTANLSLTSFTVPDPNICTGGWYRTQMQQYLAQVFDLPAHTWLKDGAAPAAIGTPAGTSLGLLGGTFGTNGISVASVDEASNAGAHTCYAVRNFVLPHNYKADGAIQLTFVGVMATAADASSNADVEAFLLGSDGDPTGSDLVSTSAQAITDTAGVKTFTIDGTGLSAGDELALRISTIINDAATGSGVIAHLKKIRMLLTTQG